MMPLASAIEMIPGLGKLASAFRTTEEGGVFEDGAVTKDEFYYLLTQVISKVSGKETDETEEASDLADSIGSVLFGMFDRDDNGVLEADEAESLKGILSFIDPDLLKATLEQSAKTRPSVPRPSSPSSLLPAAR